VLSRLRLPISCLGMLCLVLLGAASVRGQVAATPVSSAPVVVIDIKSAIGVGTAELVKDGLDFARERDAQLVVLQIDTPGGLVTATRIIIQSILGSQIPIAVYVAPSGARAASAGTYIAYAAHFAAMAPGTHLGAATPIQLGTPSMPGQPQPQRDKDKPSDTASAAEKKVVNDAVAYLRSLAQLRGRNADWAEKAVREAATLTAEDAHKEGVVEVVAPDLGSLLASLDGRMVKTAGGERTLATRNALTVPYEANWKTRLITIVTDPNIVFILMMIGIYGIIFEFWSPGLTGPGVVGAICLIVALMALSALPVSAAGIALLILGVALMIAEGLAPGFGILGLGGVVAFVLGAAFLFDPAGADIEFAVAWPVMLSATVTSVLLLVVLLGFLIRSRRSKVVTGAEEMIGLEGEVVTWAGNQGRVHVHGEIWAANGPQTLSPGARVVIQSRDGLQLSVSPSHQRSSSP
jgi:membrane-bound serine protease (ClpP class)